MYIYRYTWEKTEKGKIHNISRRNIQHCKWSKTLLLTTRIYVYLPYAQKVYFELYTHIYIYVAGVTPDKSITNIEFSIDCLVYIIIYGKVGWDG